MYDILPAPGVMGRVWAPWVGIPARSAMSDVIIFGLVGHAGALRMPLEQLDVDDLEPGREFILQGRIYEIRSVVDTEQGVQLNVVLAMDSA